MHTQKSLATLLTSLLIALPALTRADTPTTTPELPLTSAAPATAETQPVDPDKDSDAQRKEWDAIPLDTTNPKGFLRTFFKAIDTKDEKAVNALLLATKPEAKPLLTLLAPAFIARQSLRKLAIARFGQDDFDHAIGQTQLTLFIGDIENECMHTRLTRQADGSWTSDSIPLLKDSTGNYRLDLDAIAENAGSTMEKELTAVITLDKKFETLLTNNPQMTLAEFTKAATDQLDAITAAENAAATEPATQK